MKVFVKPMKAPSCTRQLSQPLSWSERDTDRKVSLTSVSSCHRSRPSSGPSYSQAILSGNFKFAVWAASPSCPRSETWLAWSGSEQRVAAAQSMLALLLLMFLPGLHRQRRSLGILSALEETPRVVVPSQQSWPGPVCVCACVCVCVCVCICMCARVQIPPLASWTAGNPWERTVSH